MSRWSTTDSVRNQADNEFRARYNGGFRNYGFAGLSIHGDYLLTVAPLVANIDSIAVRDSLTIELPDRAIRVTEVLVRPKDDRQPRIIGAIYIDIGSGEAESLEPAPAEKKRTDERAEEDQTA